MSKNVLLGVFTLSLLFGANSSAFAEGLQKGATAIGINGSLQHLSVDGEDATNMLLISANYSRFFTKNHEVGVQAVGLTMSSDDSDASLLFFDGIYNYNLTTTSNVVPYFGGGAGIVYYGIDDDSSAYFQFGAQGGLKSFLADNVYISTELRYRYLLIDEDDTDGVHQLSLNVGINLLF